MLLSALTACNSGHSTSSDSQKEYVVGICNYVDDASLNQIVENIQVRLAAIGKEQGVHFRVEYDNCNADSGLMGQIISNFQAENADLLVAVATPVAMAMQAATDATDTPVVFAAVSDPVSAGLVESMETPGANLTGTSDYLDTDAILNLIFAQNPDAKTIGLLYDVGQDSAATPIANAKAYLDAKGVAYIERTGTTVDEITLAAQSLAADGVDAIFTPTDNTVMKSELTIYETLAAAGIPHYTGADSFALNGAFLGYGVDYIQLGMETADMIAEILLEGKNPAELPVRTFDNGTATINTEICEMLGYDLSAVETAFAPYCTKVEHIVTADSFDSAASSESENTVSQTQSSSSASAFSFRSVLSLLQSTLELGLITALTVLALFLSYSMLNVCDLSTDGCFTLGAAVGAAVAISGHPYLAIPAAMLAGMLSGFITAILQTKMGINSLLSGIIVNTALYSVNIAIMGNSSVLNMNKTETVFTIMGTLLAGTAFASQSKLVVAILAVGLVGVLLALFLKTRIGLAIRATGNNPDMVRSSSINPVVTTIIGLCLANACTALSGCLLAQSQKSVNIDIGSGMVTIALASLLIGHVFLGRKKIPYRIAGMVLGAFVFRLVYTVALRLDMPAFMLKFVSAIVVVAAISIPYLKQQYPLFQRRLTHRRERSHTGC